MEASEVIEGRETEATKNIEVFDNPFIKFVHFGKIPSGNIKVNLTGKKPKREPRLQSMYEQRVEKVRTRVLKQAKERGSTPLFYDTLLPRVERLRATRDGEVEIDVGETTYFQNIAWREPSLFKELGLGDVEGTKHHKLRGNVWEEETLEYAANPLTAEAAIVIEDGKYVLLTKARAAIADQSIIKGTAGYMDFKDRDNDGNFSPEMGILREIKEESGIDQEEIEDLALVGRVVDRGQEKVDALLLWTGRAPRITREEIERRSKDQEVEIIFVPFERRTIERAVLEFAPISEGYLAGALMALALEKWGEREASFINQRLVRRGQVYQDKVGREKMERVRTKQIAKAGRAIFEKSSGEKLGT